MKKRIIFRLRKSKPVAEQWKKEDNEIRSDVLGSYTGVPDSYDLMPEQDADDL